MIIGAVANSLQFVELKSGFRCNTKRLEGIVHDRSRLLLDCTTVTNGVGVTRDA